MRGLFLFRHQILATITTIIEYLLTEPNLPPNIQRTLNIIVGPIMDVTVRDLQDFGKVVKDSRKNSEGLRQVEAARLIGVSPPVLNKIEQGKEIWLSKALEICNALGIEVILRYAERD